MESVQKTSMPDWARPDGSDGRESKRQRKADSQEVSLSPLQQKLVVQLQNACAGLLNPQDTLLRLVEIQKSLFKVRHGAVILDPNPSVPCKVFVMKSSFHVVQKAAGSGSFSNAYFTVEIPFSGEAPHNRVVKVSKYSYNSEVKLLDELSPASKTSRKIDHFVASFFDRNKQLYAAVFEPSDCDFTRVNFSKIALPVLFMSRQLMDVAEGIASFHRRNIILRDLKGANLLINFEGPGKVTDFGYLRKLNPEGIKHEATGSAFYVAPFIWDSILGQKYYFPSTGAPYEGGYQGKASDIFSLGRVIHFDVVCRLILHMGSECQLEAETIPFVQIQGYPRKIEGRFSDDVLLGFERKYPGRVIRDACSRGKDLLYIFEDHEELLKSTLDVLEKFQGKVDQGEIEKLKQLAHLARDLQDPRKEEILRTLGCERENEHDRLIQSVIQRLNAIVSQPVVRPLDFSNEYPENDLFWVFQPLNDWSNSPFTGASLFDGTNSAGGFDGKKF